MTVSVFDPVLPALLPTLMEPLSFDVTTDTSDMILSIVYSSGAWDVAYQDGMFAALYSSSTRSGAHFEIKRTGGWPEGETFKVKVKETVVVPTPPPPIVVGPGQSWGVVYAVDLAAQPSQASLVPGPVVIDGITWWLQNGPGSITGVYEQSSFLQNGVGLVIRALRGSDLGGIAQATAGHLRYFLPLANLVNYTPGAPVMVLGDFFHTSTGADDYAALGLCEGNASATAISTDTATHFSALRSTVTNPNSLNHLTHNDSGSLAFTQVATTPVLGTASRIDGVMLSNALIGSFVGYRATATTPDAYNDDLVAKIDTRRFPRVFNGSRLGISFTFQRSTTTPVRDFYLKKLYVYQPKVP